LSDSIFCGFFVSFSVLAHETSERKCLSNQSGVHRSEGPGEEGEAEAEGRPPIRGTGLCRRLWIFGSLLQRGTLSQTVCPLLLSELVNCALPRLLASVISRSRLFDCPRGPHPVSEDQICQGGFSIRSCFSLCSRD